MKTTQKNRRFSLKLKVWKVKAEFESRTSETTLDTVTISQAPTNGHLPQSGANPQLPGDADLN